MPLELAVGCVDWYARTLKAAGEKTLELHFFGGEPLYKPELVIMAVHAARIRAEELGLQTRFEIATSGVVSESVARFTADFIDSLILSIDGPPEVQNANRPTPGGAESYRNAAASGRIFSDGAGDLHLRVCVTSETVSLMKDIAGLFLSEFKPVSICYETVQQSPEAAEAGLRPPDPWEFAFNFAQAEAFLERSGVQAVYAPADISRKRVSFCPVGRDAAIVSPDGRVAGCYLLERDWIARGMDMNLGQFSDSCDLLLTDGAVEDLRELNVLNYPRCRACFCRWHCAGGCHVNHSYPGCPESYDDLCIQARIIALFQVLKGLERGDLVGQLLRNTKALRKTIMNASDSLDIGVIYNG
jgi:radical SAM protein with 4Fe4S-binding SPASM domain